MLGVKRQSGARQSICNAPMDSAHTPDRRKEPKHAAIARFDQARIGTRKAWQIAFPDVGYDQNLGATGIVEGAGGF